MPGGVNSPVRAFKAVGGDPIFFQSGQGARLTDVDGQTYIDYVCSWGPLILGHAHPDVVKAATQAIKKGSSFGAPHPAEVELAKLISKAIPSMQKLRLVSSGTEACMSALRVARAFTGRDGIIKFEGCYHGHSDGLLVKAGSGAASLGVPTSPGVPYAYSSKTFVLPYNDLKAVDAFCKKHGKEIAAIIVEPVAANMGVVLPKEGYLQGLRAITAQHGMLLIFDEVITGFRLCFGGAQNLFGITPDLTVMGKIVGGGFPVGAYGGRKDVMDLVSPEGPVYQAGTLSGNPVCVAAGLATLTALKKIDPYKKLERATQDFCDALREGIKKAKVDVMINQIGSMWTPFFSIQPVTDFSTAGRAHRDLYAKYFWGMLEQACYMPPSQFEAAFLSIAHGPRELDHTVKAFREVLSRF